MRPARIPSIAQLSIGWAVCGLLGTSVGCSSAADNTPKGIIPGMALGKFCHDLNRGGMPVSLTLIFGEPAIQSITARTGVCAPLKGMPCSTIPVGLVPLKLMEGDKVLASRSVILSNPADAGPVNEYVFQAVITTARSVAIGGGRITVPPICQDLDFPAPDGGVTDGSIGEGGAGDAAGAETGTASDAGASPEASPPPVDAPPVPVDAPPADGPAPEPDAQIVLSD